MLSFIRFGNATGMLCVKILAFVAVGMACWTLVSVSTEAPVQQAPFERLTASGASPIDRAQAAEALSHQGADAVPKLVEALGHPDPLVRRSVCYAIGRIGDGAIDAEPLLYERLSDSEPLVRSAALRTLTQMNSNSSRLARHAVAMFSDDNTKVGFVARQTVVELGRSALPEVFEAVTHQDVNVRRCVAQVLQAMQLRSRQSMAAARLLLRDDDVTVRKFALGALTAVRGVKHADLLQALSDQDAVILESALQQPRGVFHPADAELVRRLAKLLEHPRENVQLLAAMRLRIAGATARPAIPALRRLLDAVAGASKITVAETLADIGAPRDSFVPVLVNLLTDSSDEDSAWHSAWVLARYSSQDVPALIPTIERNLNHGDYMGRRAAVSALMGLGAAGRDAVPSLIRLLESNDFETRKRATCALANMGKAARQALPHLIERVRAVDSGDLLINLDYSEDLVDDPAAETNEVEQALPVLIRLSRWQIVHLWEQSRSTDLWAAEVDALGRLGVGEPAALEAVVFAVNDPSPMVRAAVANAIKNIKCDEERSTVALRQLIVDESQLVRDAAARAIGRLGLLAVISDVSFEEEGQWERLYRIASRAGRNAVTLRQQRKTNGVSRRPTG